MTQHLFIHAPTTVLAARVNMATVTYPLTEITFDTVTTGTFSAVKRGMTLLVGSSAGADDLGRQRIRLDAATNTLYIGRSSQGVLDGEVNVSDNMYLTVLNDRRAWAKIPYIDPGGLIVKDEITYTDETSNIPPKANIAGGARASTINSGTSLSTFQFVGSASYAVASGATISTYSWDVGDGTITAGTGTHTITATFPAGFRYVSLTVTDSNGKTHTQYVPVLAHNPAASLCVAFQCAEHTIGQQGQTAAFRILQDLDIDTYPDGALVIFWEGEPSSTSDFTNVRFWGWHQTNTPVTTATSQATIRDDVIYCLDVANRFKTLPGFPITVERKASPTAWSEMAGLTMDLYVDYILRWHSNLLDLTYYTPTGTGSTYPMGIISSDGQNIFDQAAQRTNSLIPDYILTCDRNGQVKSIVDPMLQDTTDRTATSQATIGTNKWIGVNWLRQRPPRFHWRRGEALQIWTTNEPNPFFCVSPGTAPGQGEGETSAGEKLVLSQSTLNSWNGHAYARINARHGLVPIQIANDDDRIQPANMTWATVNIPDTYTRRQLGFSSARGLPIEVNVTYDYSRAGVVKRAEMLWEPETSGTPAVTVIPPTPDHDPPWTPPPNPFPDPTPTGGGTGFGTVYVMTRDALGVTPDFSATSPAYSALATVSANEFWDYILDPYDPTDNGFLMTSTGLKKSENLSGAATFSDVLTLTEMETALSVSGTLGGFFQIKGCITSSGFFAFGLHDRVAGVYGNLYVYVTTDGGNTWTPYLVHSLGASAAGFAGAIEVSTKLSGTSQPIIYIASGDVSGANGYLYRSTTGGQTWSQRNSNLPTASSPCDIHLPYTDNAGSDIVLLNSQNTNGSLRGLAISTDGGTNFSTIGTANGLPTGVSGSFNRTPFQTWTQNRQRMYCVSSPNSDRDQFYTSVNGGSTFSLVHDFGARIIAAGGFPYNGSQFYVITTTGIFVTIDGGVSWLDKTGDWAWAFNEKGNPLNGRESGCVIVPNWLE